MKKMILGRQGAGAEMRRRSRPVEERLDVDGQIIGTAGEAGVELQVRAGVFMSERARMIGRLMGPIAQLLRQSRNERQVLRSDQHVQVAHRSERGAGGQPSGKRRSLEHDQWPTTSPRLSDSLD